MTISASAPPRTPQPVSRLAAVDLVKNFGPVPALQGVSVGIAPGEALAIMGPSGCGKSTLLHCLAGILPADGGTVDVDGTRVTGLSEAGRSQLRRERFGFVFQDGQLLAELTNAENVALPLMLTGMSRRDAVARASEWLARLGLPGVDDRRPTQLSGGQAQRVAIARALAHHPSVVFADEPTGALDQATGSEVMAVLTEAVADAGASLIMVTHDRAVARWCSRTVEMRDGRIVQEYAR